MLETNQIYNIDCIDGIKLLDDNSINIYDNYHGNDMEELEYRKWLSTIIKLCITKIKSNGYFALNIKYRYKNNQCILPYWILDFFNPLILRNEIIWDYLYYVDVNNSKFYPGHEIIFLFSKSINNFKFDSKSAKLGDVWYIQNASQNNEISARDHPAPFPIEIPLRIINACTDKNDIVFDPFMGSGTTAAACIKTNRKYIGFEISEKYCEIAKKRISKYQTTKLSPIKNVAKL